MSNVLFKSMAIVLFVFMIVMILTDVPYWCGRLSDEFNWRKRNEAHVTRVREDKEKIREWLRDKLKELGD